MAARRSGEPLTDEQRARWVTLIGLAAQEAGLPADPQFRAAFSSYVEWESRRGAADFQSGPGQDQDSRPPRWGWGPAGPPRPLASGAQDEDVSQPVPLPGPDQAVGFAAHIKPLFRQRDRQSMTFAFDLWSYQDVKARAQDILDRLENGSMPCDGAWPQSTIGVFRRWAESGMRP